MNGFDPSTNEPAGTTPGPHATDAFAGSAAPGATSDPYTAPGYGYTPGYGGGGPVPPPHPGLPNPGLATFLGFIPGVGAMYNGQFAKGLAHIVIFAVLVSLADHVNGIFGLLVTGWIFYMVFDAYQTARARRDGLQVPDPFGLNNIGERMGVGNGPTWSDFTAKPAPGQTPPPSGYGYAPDPQGTAYDPQTTPYAAPGNVYQNVPPNPTTAGEAPVYAQAYPPPAAPFGASPYAAPPYAAPPYGATPYAVPPTQGFPPYAAPLPSLSPAGGVPVGALWLIGLGVFALVGTLSHRFYWSNRVLDGAIVIAIGVAVLIARTLRARTVYPAGTAAATWYVLRSTRTGLILIAIGVALTLDHVSSIGWSDMWPYLLILLGVFLLLERAAHNRMLADGPVPPVGSATEATGYASAQATSSSFVPQSEPRDEEGR